MIKLQDLVKNFDSRSRVLDCVNMNVKRGSIYGLCGVNGSGKTTVIKHVTGMLKQDSGTVKVMGETVFDNTKVKMKIGYVPDELFFFYGYSLYQMAKHYAQIYDNWSWERYNSLINDFNLNDREKLSTYSKGMQKQAYFILAISTVPELLVLDEPVDGLDPIVRRKVWALIKSEVSERKMTVLVSSHNLKELEGICSMIGIMKNGQIKIEKEIDELKSDIYKLQVAFNEHVYNAFEGLDILHEDFRGSVQILIVKNSIDRIKATVEKHNPVIFDILPLTLEEIFIYEMGGGRDDRLFI